MDSNLGSPTDPPRFRDSSPDSMMLTKLVLGAARRGSNQFVRYSMHRLQTLPDISGEPMVYEAAFGRFNSSEGYGGFAAWRDR